MLDSRDEKCHAIIHSASALAGTAGAGLAQIPFADNVPITTIQVGMIVSIGKVFDIDITEGVAKGLLAGFASSVLGRNIAAVLVGWIPLWGNTIKASTAVALTESIGWAAVSHFENLERDNRTSFKHGMDHGEKLAKEKFKTILEKCKNRDEFLVLMFGISIYLGNDFSKTNDIISIFTNKETLQRLRSSLNNIDSNNPIKFIKEFAVKINADDLDQVKCGISILKKIFKNNISENKVELLFDLFNKIEFLKSIEFDTKKLKSMLDLYMPDGEFYE